MLLLPVLTLAWFSSSLLVWGFFPHLKFVSPPIPPFPCQTRPHSSLFLPFQHQLEALTIGACICPTDPVLANSITRGRFADKHVPAHVRNIIVAESGSNDGLGFPFIYIAMYLLLYNNPDYDEITTLGDAIGHWFYDVWIYQIILSVIEGFVIGQYVHLS
jgi:NhaP-type Na+/H+ or K+/H+ antiporter